MIGEYFLVVWEVLMVRGVLPPGVCLTILCLALSAAAAINRGNGTDPSTKIANGKMSVDELGVKAIEDNTPPNTLNIPTLYFMESLIHNGSFPVNPKPAEEFGRKFIQQDQMISNSGYELVIFNPNDAIIMKKRPYYWDANDIQIDQVNWISFQAWSSSMHHFEAKETDICSDFVAITSDIGERANIPADAETILLKDPTETPQLHYLSTTLITDKTERYDDNLMNLKATRWLSIKGQKETIS
ncbi:ABC transporter substrate-binding protein [Ochrobactrum sp. Marseille-Q0166]|uniref:ABC transporter substrate-binding protein n=1 Tax=Ochrobactrum sp. Marseille-Q0166 TaxID=2761105 RepID=UPI001FFF2F53|nr:ABC transporter substrate-binding protein [Ochrobactrum sp. Marseille-Q0166]